MEELFNGWVLLTSISSRLICIVLNQPRHLYFAISELNLSVGQFCATAVIFFFQMVPVTLTLDNEMLCVIIVFSRLLEMSSECWN